MPAHTEHPLEQLADEVLRTSGRLIAASADSAGGGLTGAQHLVLAAVIRAERPPTVPQIGRSLGHSRQAVRRLVDALVGRGLVAAVPNPEHKRARCLIGTDAGRALYASTDERSRAWAERVTAGMSRSAIEDAVATLRVLRHNMEIDRTAVTPHPRRSKTRCDPEEDHVGLQY